MLIHDKVDIMFTREELDGVTEGVISKYTHRAEGDKVLGEVTFRMLDIFPIVSVVWLCSRSDGTT